MPRLPLLLIAVVLISCGGPATSGVPTAAPSVAASTSAAPSATPGPSVTAAPTGSPTLSPTPIPLPSFATLSAPTGDVVWALVAGTRLFRSADRGATWDERRVPPVPPTDIAFISDREGWLLSAGSPATQCMVQAFAIWHTADGATTWERTYQSDLFDALCKDSLFFSDGQHGYLTLFSPNSPAIVARTADGGRTWSRSRPVPDPPGFTTQNAGFVIRARRVQVFDAVLLVSAVGEGAGNGKTYAFRSTDGGATWSHVSTAPEDRVDIVFVTAARWLQIVPPTGSRETTDGGASWHAFTTDYSQAAPIAPQIVFGDARVGYATVRGAIQRTTDGGGHWSAIEAPETH